MAGGYEAKNVVTMEEAIMNDLNVASGKIVKSSKNVALKAEDIAAKFEKAVEEELEHLIEEMRLAY